ncbi:MAG: ATP-binding cassette domain-containing protein [Candidatus Aminicenantes bacterium]|nr:ATP-binding cassette domain-containing protein [Candidatus Aminicenantes bacterium]
MESLISVEGISFKFGHHQVLNDIVLPIYSGDFLGILGPNGSGKTSLLKIILGLLKPSRGRVLLMQKSQRDFTEWGKIGYVPQNATHIDPYFPVSAQEVVAMGLKSLAPSERVAKAEEAQAIQEALKHVGMESHQTRRIGQLSGGQQQRIFIARAIVNRPRILFLDEPTTGVDAQTQEQFYDMLSHLNQDEKITIVLVTHEIGIINKHITKVACLNQRLIYHGTHEEFCCSQAFKEMLEGGHHLVSHRH